MQLLIINYHYIDDPTKYKAGIYPVSPDFFARQIDEVKKHFTFVSESELVSAIQEKGTLPEKSAMIIFDDGLKCQHENALPVLEAKQVPAVFFIPTRHLEGKAYTLHKIHYLLSQVAAEDLLSSLEELYEKQERKPIDWNMLDVSKVLSWYRYDKEAAAKFKYLLNHTVSPTIADALVSALFARYVSESEDFFSKKLYLSAQEITALNKHPLISIGLHTHSHLSIAQLSKEEVAEDIKKNYEILKNNLGVQMPLGLSYPFGAIIEEIYEEKVKEIAQTLGLQYALTIEKKMNTILFSPFLFGRFNPNDVGPSKNPLVDFGA